MGDDFYVGSEDGVAVGVVVVEVGVDYGADGLRRQEFDVFDERAGGGGRRAVVDEQDVVIVDDDYIVAAEAAGGVVDSFGFFFELIDFALGDRVFDVVFEARELFGEHGVHGGGPHRHACGLIANYRVRDCQFGSGFGGGELDGHAAGYGLGLQRAEAADEH